ncbi:inorganic diphosphatase [Mucilaginibacter pallidiroseus]|uniref:inorganic diphosphatase n=2 Tax=Mucilaginibacter pallidiroseus TaxID=2599295 RepID=A0A563U3J4_9SPHI|nr:inorganic diphosphatase [Mucilaginibacter pallidiroseus]
MADMDPVTVIIESPKGSGHKYDYEPKLDKFKLNKILPAGMVFPFDFGFIPGTKGGDGDPLDVLVVSEITGFPGCVVDCRIVGAIKVEQTERDGSTMRNDRFFGVPVVSHLFAQVNEIADLPAAIMEEIEAFFGNYNKLAGKEFKVIGHATAKDAVEMINK